jgi:hypothetical protein
VIVGAALGAAIAIVFWRISIRVFTEVRLGRDRR